MKKLTRNLLLIPLLCAAILVVGLIGHLIISRVQWLRDCPEGHLATIARCEKDGSWFSWMNSGWYYCLAEGKPSKIFYSEFFENNWPTKALFNIGGDAYEFKKGDCSATAGPQYDVCYEFYRPAVNGNTHYYFVLASDRECTRGMYFEGSARRLKDGKVVKAWAPETKEVQKWPIYPDAAHMDKICGPGREGKIDYNETRFTIDESGKIYIGLIFKEYVWDLRGFETGDVLKNIETEGELDPMLSNICKEAGFVDVIRNGKDMRISWPEVNSIQTSTGS